MKQFRSGFVVGKFMPLHNGHVHLIETALSQSERVAILLFSEESDAISGLVRAEWLHTAFPTASIVRCTAPLPRDETGFAHWKEWLSAIQEVAPGPFDAVFSSEAYGERLASDMGATHVLVDQQRSAVPVSATQIRENPGAYRDFMPAHVWVYFDKL